MNSDDSNLKPAEPGTSTVAGPGHDTSTEQSAPAGTGTLDPAHSGVTAENIARRERDADMEEARNRMREVRERNPSAEMRESTGDGKNLDTPGYDFDSNRPGANKHGIGPDVGGEKYAVGRSYVTIVPEVGRAISYMPGPDEVRSEANPQGAMQLDVQQPFAATVVFCHNLTTANIVYRDHRGKEFVRLSVEVVQDGNPAPIGPVGFAFWTPYQINAARRGS